MCWAGPAPADGSQYFRNLLTLFTVSIFCTWYFREQFSRISPNTFLALAGFSFLIGWGEPYQLLGTGGVTANVTAKGALTRLIQIIAEDVPLGDHSDGLLVCPHACHPYLGQSHRRNASGSGADLQFYEIPSLSAEVTPVMPDLWLGVTVLASRWGGCFTI